MTDSLIEKAISILSPAWALRRAQSRRILSYYEGAKPSTTRKGRREHGSGDVAVLRAGASLREQARHLEQNHDLARGALDILVANIVGPHGVHIEPQPCNRDGTLHQDLARQIRRLLRDWSKQPEVTAAGDWAACQRLACRTWIRDGEFLAQKLMGRIGGLDHGTAVPFSLELLEADYLPFELIQMENPWVVMGVERNTWGRPVAYHLYERHPGDWLTTNAVVLVPGMVGLRRIPAERMLHPKLVDRFRQARGVSVFASVLGRLEDIKDYEESERVAAKVAASMAAFIKKGSPDTYDPSADGEPRGLKFVPGMVFDDLLPGEEIGTIDTSRPNANLEMHRKGQLRAAASGMGVSSSSLTKDYSGTYSSQRQELVESYGNYGICTANFVTQFVRPVYEAMLDAAIAAGLLKLPRNVDPITLKDALFFGPQMPWIDPQKEATAWETLERNGHASGPEIIRRRGFNPMDIFEQEKNWRAQWKDAGLVNSADPSNDNPPKPSNPTADNQPDTTDE